MKYIKPVKVSRSTGLLAKVYAMISRDFLPIGKIPGGNPATIHSLHPNLLLAWWNVLRETILVKDLAPRNYKESIATAVSLSNDCTFCIDQHAAMLRALGDKESGKGIPICDLSEVVDQKQMKLIYWALGHTNKESYFVRNPPFTPVEAPEIIGTALVINYVNHLVEIFLKDSPLNHEMKLIRSVLRDLMSLFLKNKLNDDLESGSYVNEQHHCEFDISWLEANDRLKSVWLTFIREADRLATQHIPMDVQKDFINALKNWSGVNTEEDQQMGILGRNAVTLCYLKKSGFYPQKVNDDDIRMLRNVGYDDKGILALTTWSSLSVSLRIGEWLGSSFSVPTIKENPPTRLRVEGKFE